MESGKSPGNNSNGGGQLYNGDEDEGQIIGVKRKRIIYNKVISVAALFYI